MSAVPAYSSQRSQYGRELTAAMQPGPTSGWPEVGGPYQVLIEGAERVAGSLAIMSTVVPGLLKDPGLAEVQLSRFSPEDRSHRLQLLLARQRHAGVRLDDPHNALDLMVCMPDDVMTSVGRTGSQYMAPQAARLLEAIHQGCDIRMVYGPALRAAMGAMNTSLIAMRLPGTTSKLLYREYDNREPHESVHTDPQSLEEARALECTMRAKTLRPSAVLNILRTYAGNSSAQSLARRRI